MKTTINILSVSLLLSSYLCTVECNGSGSEQQPQPANRSTCVAALKEMKHAMDINDSNAIVRHFPRRTVEYSYMEYREVVGTCKEILARLDIAKLQDGDTVTRSIMTSKSPCMEKYSITIDADSLKFTDVMDKKTEYKMPQQDTEDEIDPSSLCEHMQWYHFRLVNGHLILTSLGGAD